jgi:hypothetical protein
MQDDPTTSDGCLAACRFQLEIKRIPLAIEIEFSALRGSCAGDLE